jgi:protocatechuate 3,4-dioxygenase beta subunit
MMFNMIIPGVKNRRNGMTLETDDDNNKLKRRMPTAISAAKAVITILYLLCLLLTYTTFVNLPQSSFAQTKTTNTNQTSTEVKTQLKTLTTPCNLTEPTAQGPEYKAGPPFKQGQDFAKGLQGQRLELSGRVLNMATCKPVQGAVLDLWQTNSSGDYDYKGFNLRGKIVSDKDGKYVLDTIYPARLHSEGNITRPSHIHVMVGALGQPIITTQVYFEGQPRDFAVKDSLITKTVTDQNGTKIAHFDFVVEDYRGFDISKGIIGNPTIGAIQLGSSNK